MSDIIIFDTEDKKLYVPIVFFTRKRQSKTIKNFLARDSKVQLIGLNIKLNMKSQSKDTTKIFSQIKVYRNQLIIYFIQTKMTMQKNTKSKDTVYRKV